MRGTWEGRGGMGRVTGKVWGRGEGHEEGIWGHEEGLSFCSGTPPTELTQRSRASQRFRDHRKEAVSAMGPLGHPRPSA